MSTTRGIPVLSSARGELAPENRRSVYPLALYSVVFPPQFLADPGSCEF